MNENLKTIRELAEELDVSKQAIQYHIKSLTTKTRQTNDKGIVVLSLEEQQFIRSKVDKETKRLNGIFTIILLVNLMKLRKMEYFYVNSLFTKFQIFIG